MARILLFAILIVFVARALAKLWRGLMEGLDGRSYADRVPTRRAQMVRDPVCGTFVLPDAALVLENGRERQYFCSTQCRDQYRRGSAGPERGTHGSSPSRGAA
jgi:YHS domain-containing protein